MKKYFILIISFAFPAMAQEIPAVITLKDAYQLAVKQSEAIAITDELIKQAEAQYGQALGGSFPEIYFGYDSTWQDRPPPSATSTPGSFFISPQTNTKIGARKTLFTGYKELAAINSGSNFVGQRKDEKNRALQLLLNDIGLAFYSALQSEADLQIIKKDLELLQDRMKETRQRASLGRSRSADVSALESQIQTLDAQRLETERLVGVQRDLLSFYTGQTMVSELHQSQPLVNVESLNIYLAHVEKRPDIQAQEKAIDVSNALVKTQRSLHFPSVDLYANYYLDRKGYREGVDWDASIFLEFPLWAWGATQKGVNAAKAEYRRQELLAKELKRKAEIDVQTAYRDVQLLRQQNEMYEKAKAAAEKEHTQTARDYRSGLVNTFDVLESMDRLYQSELALNQAVLKTRLAELNLKIIAGYTPEEILQ